MFQSQHQQNPLTRFDNRAQDYANYRPNYPAATLNAIVEGFGAPNALTVADIGAGTGISSRQLADLGLRVWAIEPNAAMRSAAAPHSRVTYFDATAERTSLADSSVELVTCFQAFHWFEPHATLLEFERILCPAGRLALVWNERDSRDAFTAEYGAAILEASGDDPVLKHAGAELSADVLAASTAFCNARVVIFPNSKRMTREALFGSCLSASYVPREGPAHDKLMVELDRIHRKYAGPDGSVEMIYRTESLLAERA